MRRISKVLLSLICILGFTSNVFAAATSSITTNVTGTTTYEYIEGLEIYKNYASSYNLYVLDRNTHFDSRTTLSDPEEADSGFAYIINNSNVTSSSEKNYYIAQIAILWYQDYLNGNDNNISSAIKTKITNNTNNTVAYYINKLVNGAKEYSKNDSSIKFIDEKVTFTKSGNYYYSNVIDVETDNLRSTPSVKLHNAPTSATVVSNSLTKDGEGSFQIRIPVNSFNSYNDSEFLIEITGSGYDNTVYEYSKYGTDKAIYGRLYSTTTNNEEASMIVKIDEFERTNVRISVVDSDGDYISGLRYYIYSGDCRNTTCNSNNLIENFTTKNTYTNLSNLLASGEYTLVNKSDYEEYDLPEKTVIEIKDTTYTQEFVIDAEGDNSGYYSKTTFTIYNSLNDKYNTIKIYNSDDTLIDSFKADKSSYKISLYPGNYYIVDADKTLKAEFEIRNNGDIYVTEGANEVKRTSIDLDYYFIRTTTDKEDTNQEKEENTNKDNNVNKEPNKEQNKENTTNKNETITNQTDNKETNSNVVKDNNGNIHIDNLDNIESIDITNKVETTTDVKVEWLNSIVDCPITSLSSTIKYIIGAIILGTGLFLVVRNVKKQKNNI